MALAHSLGWSDGRTVHELIMRVKHIKSSERHQAPWSPSNYYIFIWAAGLIKQEVLDQFIIAARGQIDKLLITPAICVVCVCERAGCVCRSSGFHYTQNTHTTYGCAILFVLCWARLKRWIIQRAHQQPMQVSLGSVISPRIHRTQHHFFICALLYFHCTCRKIKPGRAGRVNTMRTHKKENKMVTSHSIQNFPLKRRSITNWISHRWERAAPLSFWSTNYWASSSSSYMLFDSSKFRPIPPEATGRVRLCHVNINLYARRKQMALAIFPLRILYKRKCTTYAYLFVCASAAREYMHLRASCKPFVCGWIN